MPAPRSFLEAVGEGLGQVANAYPSFYEMAQRKKRDEDRFAYEREQDKQGQLNWERGFEADEATRLFNREQGKKEDDYRRHFGLYNMILGLDAAKRAEIEGEREYGLDTRRVAAEELRARTDADQAKTKAAWGGFTPSQAYENVGQAYTGYTKFRGNEILGSADDMVAKWGLRNSEGKQLAVSGRDDLVTAVGQVPMTRDIESYNPFRTFGDEPVPGAQDRVSTLQSMLDQYDALNSPTHRAAWTTSPDSIASYDPNLASMLGVQPSQPESRFPSGVDPADTMPASSKVPVWQSWGYESAQAAADTLTADFNAGLMDRNTYQQYMMMLRQ